MTANLVITDAGAALLADGANRAARAVNITRLATGDGTGAVNKAQVALRSQRDLVAAGGTTSVGGRIALIATFGPSATYSVTEIGVFARSGAGPETLFAYWSAANAAGAAAAAQTGTRLALAGTIDIGAAAAEVTVNASVNVDFTDSPDATAAQRGLVELATNAEATAGADTERAMTPAATRAAIDDRVPPASLATAGKIEIATAAEADAGADSSRAMTPALVKRRIDAFPEATATIKGKVELATLTEARAGADDTRALTPRGGKELVDRAVPAAGEAVAGKAEIATNAEADAGADDARIMTPAKVKRRIDTLISRIRALEARPVGDTVSISKLAADVAANSLPTAAPGTVILSASIAAQAGGLVSVSIAVDHDAVRMPSNSSVSLYFDIDRRIGSGPWVSRGRFSAKAFTLGEYGGSEEHGGPSFLLGISPAIAGTVEVRLRAWRGASRYGGDIKRGFGNDWVDFNELGADAYNTAIVLRHTPPPT